MLDETQGAFLLQMAGYRNRLVHFSGEVSDEELYEMCTPRAGDVERVLEALLGWVRAHPELGEGRL